MSSVLEVKLQLAGGVQTNAGVGAFVAGASPETDVWITCDVLLDAASITEMVADQAYAKLIPLTTPGHASVDALSFTSVDNATAQWWTDGATNGPWGTISGDTWYTVEFRNRLSGGVYSQELYIDTVSVGAITLTTETWTQIQNYALQYNNAGSSLADGTYRAYYRNLTIGTSRGASDIFDMGTLTTDIVPPFSSEVDGGSDVLIADDPASPAVEGRVLIAFDDGPLVADPTWTRIDGADAPFPDNFVSGYDVRVGRQTLLSQTDTGEATVYINDYRLALFDPRNISSDFYGKLDGRQILLQLYDPVAEAWEDQFRGLIDDITWNIDGSAVGADGQPINASIQIDCVDIFDFLAGYGLTPGLDGVTPRAVPSGGTAGAAPPTGFEDGVYYAATEGTVDDRMIQILTDVGVDPDMYIVASGNVHVKEVKYDPDESALQALRDAADAELPWLANISCNRHGQFSFRGRYSRFDPDDVAAEPGSRWDFTRWAVGDGSAIQADPTRAQMRVLSFGRNRSDLINVAIGYPQDLDAADMPGQVYADNDSITAYGKHSAPPMSDLLLDKDVTQPVSGLTGKDECFHFAKLLVLNQKDPRENVTALQVKAILPTDPRAETTWALITRADISHIVNVAVGYPGGTGLAGESPEDDYYIEGRELRVRPLNPSHDYVELELAVSPAVWSMDTNSVFAPFPGPEELVLTADFTSAE